uniref:hypothetical protein n=1 Tax=Haslea pseudostrearia TaxID=197756 RepID=UPI00220662C3|nr:hypothetical protein ON958_pgp093 [Haslea pseudostrearia]UXN44607.1 hypothetical protein [Haslea pseudostrearia]
MLEDDGLKQSLRAYLMEGEAPTTTGIEMKPWESVKDPLTKFNLNPDQTFKESIKARMKEELRLVENPTLEQLEEIIHSKKIKIKPKRKTVYFRDLIEKIGEDPDDIIAAKIVKEAIKVKVEN